MHEDDQSLLFESGADDAGDHPEWRVQPRGRPADKREMGRAVLLVGGTAIQARP